MVMRSQLLLHTEHMKIIDIHSVFMPTTKISGVYYISSKSHQVEWTFFFPHQDQTSAWK